MHKRNTCRTVSFNIFGYNVWCMIIKRRYNCDVAAVKPKTLAEWWDIYGKYFSEPDR